jgi:hypothetical protein
MLPYLDFSDLPPLTLSQQLAVLVWLTITEPPRAKHTDTRVICDWLDLDLLTRPMPRLMANDIAFMLN